MHRLRLAITIAVWLSSPLLLAQVDRTTSMNAPANQESYEEIIVTLKPSVSPRDLAYLASVTVPVEYKTRRAESLAEIAQDRYGLKNRLRPSLVKLNAPLSSALASAGKDVLWTKLPQDTPVKLVPVTRVVQNVTVKVPAKTSVSQLAAQFYPQAGPKTVSAIMQSNSGKLTSDNIPAHTEVLLPSVPTTHVLRIRPGYTADGVLASLAAKGIGTGTKNVHGLLETPIIEHPAERDIPADEKWFFDYVSASSIIASDLNLSSAVVVAVLDSGIDLNHPAFAKNLWVDANEGEEYIQPDLAVTHGIDAVNYSNDVTDIEPHSHGTHVAGIASARLFKQWSEAFASPSLDDHIKLMIVRVATAVPKQDSEGHFISDGKGGLEVESRVDLGAVLIGTEFATKQGARIVSGSWNAVGAPDLQQKIESKAGTLFVFAAGNDSQDLDAKPKYPASFRLSNMITVGALDPRGAPAYFSNHGAKTVQIFAPGYKIKSTVTASPQTSYDFESGTSQATPLVTLTAALIWAKDGSLPPASIRHRILNTADPDPTLDAEYGRLNMLKAISIDTDLLQIRTAAGAPREFLRGTILNSTLRIATDGNSCAATTPIDVLQDKVVRLFLTPDGTPSTLIAGKQRRQVKVCDTTYKIRTADSQVIEKPVSDVADLVWRLRK